MPNPSVQPLVSIVIPVYNGSNYLKEAIDSALAQTYKNIEVLVINDGSRDEGKTREIALSYGNRIRYFEKENGGVATALNMGISEMQGEYFSWLSHDDMYMPRKIEAEVEEALRHEEPVIVYSNISVISEGKPIEHRTMLPQAKKSMRCFLPLDVTTGLNGCTLLIPKPVFEKYGTFNPDLRYTQDYDLWFRLAKHVRFEGLMDRLVLSRFHPEQDCQVKSGECKRAADILHEQMLKNLSETEFKEFIDGDFEYILHSYRCFKINNYLKTARSILSAIVKMAKSSESRKLKTELLEDLLEWPGQNLKPFVATTSQVQAKQKKRILIYHDLFLVGGLERITYLVAGLLKDDYEVIIASSETEQICPFDFPDGVQRLKIRNNNYQSIPERLMLLCIALEIELFIGCPNVTHPFLDVYPLLREAGVKTIAWNHYFYFLPIDMRWREVTFKRSDVHRTASASVWLTSFSTGAYSLLNDNGVFMPNPVTYPHKPDPADAIKKDKKVVLGIGRFFDPIKRVDLILQAFQKVLARVPDAKLMLVGKYNLNARIPTSNERTVGEMVKEFGFDESSIIFIEESNRVQEFYKKASVLLMTSDNEGFPAVVNEAAHFGVPTVLFEIPGMEDLVTDGENGYIIPRYDFDGMADKIAALLTDDDLRRTMGRNAQEMSRRFSHDLIGRRWKDLIETIFTYKDDEELNNALSERFGAKIPNYARFSRQVAHCYEEAAIRLARSTFQVPPHLSSNCELEQFKASVYYKTYEKCRQNPLLRLLSNTTVKPTLQLSWHVYKKTRGWVKQLRIW